MRTVLHGLSTAALLTAGALGVQSAQAAPLPGLTAVPQVETSVQQVQYYYNDHNYCWYYDGWHGPGWYWCGYAWRRGIGWGSPAWGWNNWAWRGPRYFRGPGYHGGPGPRRFYHR